MDSKQPVFTLIREIRAAYYPRMMRLLDLNPHELTDPGKLLCPGSR